MMLKSTESKKGGMLKRGVIKVEDYEVRTYIKSTIEKDELSFLEDYQIIPIGSIGFPFIPPSLLDPKPRQLSVLQVRLEKVGLIVDDIETKFLFNWLFTSFVSYEDFVVYDSKSKAWHELEESVNALIRLKTMKALKIGMSSEEAEKLIRKKKDYSYLISLSDDYPRSFVVSTVKDGKVWQAFVTPTLYGIHSWSISSKNVTSDFFPFSSLRNKKHSDTLFIDVMRFTAARREVLDFLDAKLVSSITGEQIENEVWDNAVNLIFEE